MQQAMNEITDYLATIDEKVDDVLRAQKDAVLARMIGVGFVIDEAMTIREHGGRVNEVTWSKVHATSATIAETQAYALRQLDTLAQKMERKTKIRDLATATQEAESSLREWLAVVARCFQLTDAIAVLELDRVLDAAPEDLEAHSLGLRTARRQRLDTILRSTEHLIDRIDAAIGMANTNTKVLLHPRTSPAVVLAGNQASTAIIEFHRLLGVEDVRRSSEARRWSQAAAEVRDKALETGAGGVDAAKRRGSETLGRARSARDTLHRGFAKRSLRRNDEESERDERNE